MRKKKINLKVKLLIAFLAMGVIPAAVIGVTALVKSQNALTHTAYDKLEGMGKIKHHQISNYIETAFRDMSIFSKSQATALLYDALVKYHSDMNITATGKYDVSTSEYQNIWQREGSPITNYWKENGQFYDIFLICAKHGHVMYTAAKKSDLGENLSHGRYKDTGLAQLWRKVVNSGQKAFVDFSPYAPSNDDPAAFAGYPFRGKDGRLRGVIAFQMSVDILNEIMQTHSGMGQTGETYLVGPDKLMRSDSVLDPIHHSIKASFTDPDSGSVDTEAVAAALSGQKGKKLITGYSGKQV